MRDLTAAFILLGPPLVLLADAALFWTVGEEATITHVVRTWACYSWWPEAVYILGALLLWGHLFRGWL